MISSTFAVAILFVAAPSVAAATAPQERATESKSQAENPGAVYMRTKERAVLRNFQDENGAQLATLEADTLVRAFRKSSGKTVFNEVEVAGGFPVWVYGEFLQPTDTEGVLLVTGNRVNMRPFPETSPASMALRSKLNAGERVRMIERAGKAAAFREDWIRVEAPTNTKAWIVASALAPADPAKSATEWKELNTPLPTARPRPATSSSRPAKSVTGDGSATQKGGRAASSPQGTRLSPAAVAPVAREVLERLAEADAAFVAADEMGTAKASTWSEVAEAYREVADRAPTTSLTYERAMQRLQEAEVRQGITELRENLEAAQVRDDEKKRRIDEFLEARRRSKTALWGRFEERGWLEARKVGGERRWYLTFGGETVAEVRCLNDRYDLDVFQGFEIGVLGREIAPVVRATGTSLAEARVVDAQRIEVISGSAKRRRR